MQFERNRGFCPLPVWAAVGFVLLATPVMAGTFRVATYNLDGYMDQPRLNWSPKSEAARAKIRESIRSLNPDVLAMQEVGSPSALEELRASLQKEGIDFPHVEFVRGFDTNVHLSILSKFPFTARRPHTNESFLLSGRRFRVARGIGEVRVRVNSGYSFTLLTAHLKSRRAVPEADEAELRLEEAKILRQKVDALLAADPLANLVVLGDLNDTQGNPSTRAVIGGGRTSLLDTRPAERNGDDSSSAGPTRDRRGITWTYFYAKEDTYSRIDYILLSPGMAREWVAQETFVATVPNWGVGSDHRPLVATFHDAEK